MATNDFSIQVATSNGSGSQSSNSVLMRAIFQMGIPVSGKNLFPSNIQGLPTWFTIRVSKDGYTGRCPKTDVLVCMNLQTAHADVKRLRPGAACVYDAPLRLNKLRDDIEFYEVPFARLAAAIPNTDTRIRKLLANMCYVGVLAELLGIELAEIERALDRVFKGKTKAIELNKLAINAGVDHARKHFFTPSQSKLERMDRTAGKLIIDGNTATAIGCLMAGCTVLAWYPITPSTGVAESFTALARKYRHNPQTGKATYAVIQAEDELASIGMAIGAGWAGARAMTATSGPGLSLMSELTGLGYYAEVPAVIVDVQRVGPSTGLPTRTQQGDVLKAATLSHGDTRHICLFPANMQECYQLPQDAFDLAEQFQTPVFVLLDLDLGMNSHMTEPFAYPEKPLARGKVLDAGQLENLRLRNKRFERYGDVDNDGIPYRTLPGTNHPLAAYFSRGSGHNEKAGYSESPEEYTRNMDRLRKKFDTARQHVPTPVLSGDEDSEVGLLAYGSTDAAMPEAVGQLAAQGVKTEYLRVRAFPFSPAVLQFLERKKRVYVIEQNRDAQMLALLKTDLPAEHAVKFRSVLHYDGLPIDAQTISAQILRQEGIASAPADQEIPSPSGFQREE